MKFRGTLAWILVFLALAGYVLFIEIPSGEKAEEEKTRAEKILHFDELDVEALEIVQNGILIRVTRTGLDSWKLEQPVQDNANPSAINQLIYELGKASFSRVVDPQPKDVSGYGLDSPSLKITVDLKDQPAQVMELGSTSPIGQSHYVRVTGQSRILLSDLDKSLLAKSTDDLRDRTLFDFQTAEIDAIRVRYNEEEQTFTKQDGGWVLAGAVNGAADADEIMNFLSRVQSGFIMRFKDEQATDLKLYGLDRPRIEFTARAKAKSKTWTLRIGTTENDKQSFAQRNPDGNVFTVGNLLVNALSRNFITFLDKRLFDFDEKQVAQIHFQHGSETVRLKRDTQAGGAWTIVQPAPANVDPVTINSLLFDLKDVRVEEFIKAEDLSLFGLDTPKRKLSVLLADGSRQSVQLGNANSRQDLYFAQRSRDQSQFVISARTVKKIFRTLHDLKNKHLMDIEEDRVDAIVIEYPDTTFKLARNKKGWSLVQPEKIESVPAHVGKDILWALGNLEFEAQSDPSHKPENTGLDAPKVKITLRGPRKQTLGWIAVGKALDSSSLHYAEVDSRSSVFQIKKRFLDEIPSTLEQFRPKPS